MAVYTIKKSSPNSRIGLALKNDDDGILRVGDIKAGGLASKTGIQINEIVSRPSNTTVETQWYADLRRLICRLFKLVSPFR